MYCTDAWTLADVTAYFILDFLSGSFSYLHAVKFVIGQIPFVSNGCDPMPFVLYPECVGV